MAMRVERVMARTPDKKCPWGTAPVIIPVGNRRRIKNDAVAFDLLTNPITVLPRFRERRSKLETDSPANPRNSTGPAETL